MPFHCFNLEIYWSLHCQGTTFLGNCQKSILLQLWSYCSQKTNFQGHCQNLSPISTGCCYWTCQRTASGNEFPAFRPDSLIAFVDVSSNNFPSKVPSDFGLFSVMLSLSQNGFYGPLPENFSNLIMLEHLDLHENNISGEFPALFSQMSSLQVLNLRNNSIKGSISNDLSSLSSLSILDLSNNNLKGEIPQSLGNLTGMIETPDVPLTLSEFFKLPVEIHDSIVNWKKAKQGLSMDSSLIRWSQKFEAT